MICRTLTILFLTIQVFAYKLPTGLATSDSKRILDRFGAAFLVKQPHFNKHEESLKAHVHGSVSVI
ncbi:MAG: hypothetical protein ACK5W9_01860, partial [Bdellovibrionales bacterium]